MLLKINHFEFKDLFLFCPSSLETLAEDYDARGGRYEILKQSVIMKTKDKQKVDKAKFKMAKKKLVFPYEFLDDPDLLDMETLPEKFLFYSSLKESHISQESYDRGLQFWSTFKCRNLGDYFKLYCHIDVLLTAEIFTEMCRDFYEWSGLDCCKYVGLPGICHDIFLKTTKSEVGLITDKKMLEIVQRGIRGGFCLSSTKLLFREDGYELLYVDENNLYVRYILITYSL